MQKSRLTAIAACVFAAGLLLCAAEPAAAQRQFAMKMGGIAVNDPAHHYMNRLKEKIEAKTNGRIKGEVYPGAQPAAFRR